MLSEKFVFLAISLNFFGASSYVVETLRGRTKPNRVTWFLWALAPLIAFFAELDEEVGVQALMTLMVGLMPALIFLASFVNEQSSWQITRFDVICGALSMAGLALWLLTQVGNVAILFSILADGLAGVPTVVKAWRRPETESSGVFWLAAMSALITLLTLDRWDFAHVGFPLYILGICGLLAVLITFCLGKRVSRGNMKYAG